MAQFFAMISTFLAGLTNVDWAIVVSIVFLLAFSAFFSGSETALTAASRSKLRARADKGSRAAARALSLTEDTERLIGGVLLGNNLVNILAASLATSLFTKLFGDSGVALATLVMTFLVLVFSEVMPKTYAISNPETAAMRVSPIIGPLVTLFTPFVAAVRVIVRITLRIFGVNVDAIRLTGQAEEEIAGAIALGHSEGDVEKEDRDRLLAALDLSKRTVEEIMLHRSEIEMINADLPPLSILEQCQQSPFTRLPVFKGEPENIIGVMHSKTLLRSLGTLTKGGFSVAKFKPLEVATEPYFVPETTPLDDQMREFLRRRSHFALVVDEYGALQGLITLEDIIEEIVGEINDEHDKLEEEDLSPYNDGSYYVDGSTTIRDFNRASDWNLPDDEANTLAGLVIHEAQMIPSVGQVFSFHGYRFEVAGRQENRITKLKIRPL
jgi:Mg2+/Co2+ transporter CorB